MRLSQNFTLDELCKSQTAERKGIPNLPNTDEIEALELLCENILQPIRDKFGPFMVSSGFRSPELCVAIGSKITSQHCCANGKCAAADFEVAGVDNYDLARWIEGNLPFDQLILECYTGGNSGWVHCSYADEVRRETLTYSRAKGYRKGLLKDG
jgi:zinc D-Ala-D-Ala carboxypeptidase